MCSLRSSSPTYDSFDETEATSNEKNVAYEGNSDYDATSFLFTPQSVKSSASLSIESSGDLSPTVSRVTTPVTDSPTHRRLAGDVKHTSASQNATSAQLDWRSVFGLTRPPRSNTKHLDRSLRQQRCDVESSVCHCCDSSFDRYVCVPSSCERSVSQQTTPSKPQPTPVTTASSLSLPEKLTGCSDRAVLATTRHVQPQSCTPPLLPQPRRYCKHQQQNRRRRRCCGCLARRLFKRRCSSLERNYRFPADMTTTAAKRVGGTNECGQAPTTAVASVAAVAGDTGGGAAGAFSRAVANFVNKPARGWLHRDSQVAGEGICYAVRYIGCLEVCESMKSLSFEMRSLVAKECISRVCEAAGLRSFRRGASDTGSLQRPDRKLVSCLGSVPIMDNAGCNVTLNISSSRLALFRLEDGRTVSQHDMPNISFASGGDPDALDFVAYVAKDHRYGRVCFVLECGGVAQNVIATIGQAFELRYQDYLKRTRLPPFSQQLQSAADTGEREYYNDLPGKVPPDLPQIPVPPPPTSLSANVPEACSSVSGGSRRAGPGLTLPASSDGPASGENLIDLNTPPANSVTRQHVYVNGAVLMEAAQVASTAGAAGTSVGVTGTTATGSMASTGGATAASVGTSVGVTEATMETAAVDPFDMQPFSNCLSLDGAESGNGSSIVNAPAKLQKQRLRNEPWFHGVTSRKAAEALLERDGDFLVRESHGAPGQFVLSGQQGGVKKHLLLVDPKGVVRTKDRTFNNVSHLIQYHCDYQLPIISAETALFLRHAVTKS